MPTLTTLPSATFVSAAFAELLDDVTNLLESATAQKPRDTDEIGFWKRQLNALNKAEYHWNQGVRLVISGDTYLLPSASRPGALVHRLTKHGGIVVCSCEAGQRGLLCHHHMAMNVIERASELAALAAVADPPIDIPDEPYPPTPGGPEPPEWRAAFVRRLSAARVAGYAWAA